MRSTAITLLLITLSFPLTLVLSAPPLIPEGWTYWREITITEQSGTDLTNYQLLIDLSSVDMSKAKSDGSDLRFYDNSGNKLRHYIYKWNATLKQVFVEISISASSNTTIYMFYGNPDAVDESTTAIFEFYDDFETDRGWVYEETLSSFSGSYSTAQYVSPVQSYKISFPSSTSATAPKYGRIKKELTLSLPVRIWVHAYDSFTGATSGYWYKRVLLINATGAETVLWSEDVAGDEGGWLFIDVNTTAPSGAYNVTLELKLSNNIANFGVSIYWDDIIVLKYVDPEPSVSIGAEHINNPPMATIVGPSGNITDPTPTIKWSYSDPDGDAQGGYRVQVSEVSDFSSLLVDYEGTGTNTTYELQTELRGGKTYYARVKVKDKWGAWSDWSSTTEFFMNIPYIVDLRIDGMVDPQNLNNRKPVFSWTYRDPANRAQEKFQIQVGTSQKASDMWDYTESSSDTSIEYGGETLYLNGETYYLRARVFNGQNWSAWAYATFTMSKPTPAGRLNPAPKSTTESPVPIPTREVIVVPPSGGGVRKEILFLSVSTILGLIYLTIRKGVV